MAIRLGRKISPHQGSLAVQFYDLLSDALQ